MLAVWWVIRPCTAQQPPIANAAPREEKFHVEGYPIENLPGTAKVLTYVASFYMDGQGMDLLPAQAGFLTRENDDYILHDWRDGHCRWRVRVNTEHGWGQPGPWSEIGNSSFALSGDGRYFAASKIVPFEGKDDTRRVGERCTNWILSPDERSVILKYQYMGIGVTAVLYRW